MTSLPAGRAPRADSRTWLAGGLELRCSAIVARGDAVLLVRRSRDRQDAWALPGGTPRPGESMAACVRREAREETELPVDPARVAFVLEVAEPDSASVGVSAQHRRSGRASCRATGARDRRPRLLRPLTSAGDGRRGGPNSSEEGPDAQAVEGISRTLTCPVVRQ
jgi:ADP-ribose pyrophosphatase YjhB (NUDIX family)